MSSIYTFIHFFYNKLHQTNIEAYTINNNDFASKKMYKLKNRIKENIVDTLFDSVNLTEKRHIIIIIDNIYSASFTQKEISVPFFSYYKKYKVIRGFISKKRKQSVIKSNNFLTSTQKTYDQFICAKTRYFKLYPTIIRESSVNDSKVSQFKSIISIITNTRFNLYQINALSLVRYAFNKEKQEDVSKYMRIIEEDELKTETYSKNFLQNFERKISTCYKYVAVFIKDLIRICFFCRYIKKASFIANFFAYTIPKLSRNRKETVYVRFLIKLLKICSSQRKEIIGIRIRFQGRVNR